MNINEKLMQEFNLTKEHVDNIVALLDDGNTVPFIARYRTEVTGSMDDETLRKLEDRLRYLRNLDERRAEITSSIEAQEKMTPELGFRLMGDTSTILAETYDKIGEILPQGQRAEVSEMQMIDFIDPAVAEPLIDVQDKLEGFSMRPGMEEKEK